MSHRSRRPKAQLHVHCESCYSRRCRARVEASVSCALVPCRLLCGAAFHLCKEEDHLLLCPNVRVPCLNAGYGCPVSMTRSGQAAHLQVCPASVVFCSMEWNRWPAEDAHAHPNVELHENLLKVDGGRGGSLDLALALRDQDQLFHTLKMRKLFPELIQSTDEDERRDEAKRKENKQKKRAALDKEAADRSAAKAACGYTWEPMSWVNMGQYSEEEEEEEEEKEAGPEPEAEAEPAQGEVNAQMLENYNAWERMFSMEMGGCREAGSAAGGTGRGKSNDKGKGLGALVEEDTETPDTGATASTSCPGPRRQGKSLRVSTSASASSCLTSSQRNNFVYGHVEPMKIVTVRTFHIPTSFAAKHSRIRNPAFYKKETHAVDTSDLGVALEDMPIWEEIQASLLCSLEKEQRGHLIAEGMCSDALLQDEGTQTYSFLSAPFHHDTSLADLTAGKPLQLHLQLQVEGVTARHHKASSAFTFLCGHTFQRREYGQHFSNVHSDIQMCVNGWFEQRCPLAYLGCTYSQRRFQPSTHKATVTYNQELGSFSLRPTIPTSSGEGSLPPGSSTEPPTAAHQRKRPGRGGGGEDSLGTLPYEVLCHVASFLDSLSLSQLALVSRQMREVCCSLLQERGMVSLRWEKTCSHGGAKWRVTQKVWQFSTLFSPVDRWCFQDVSSISEHLKVCPYYQRESRTERVLLPRIREDVRTKTPCKSSSLLGLLQKKKNIIM